MSPLLLLYAKNVLCRRGEVVQQELTFAVVVQNLAYQKCVEVIWAGEDGRWRELPAGYLAQAGQNYEIWQARAALPLTAAEPLPRDIEFCVRVYQAGQTYAAPDHPQKYTIHADAGILLGDAFSLLHVDYQPLLSPGQTSHPITIVTGNRLPAECVSVRWTTDRWETCAETPAFFLRRHWHREAGSRAGNPNRYGNATWLSELRLGDAYRVEYALRSVEGHRECWDNNFGENYLAQHSPFRVMTLNLHCYQEERQDEKFWQVARAIRQFSIDVVCLQEVGEPWNEGRGDWSGNAAKLIGERVGESYAVHTDWGHIGFGQYREGTAILSRYPFRAVESSYVSATQDLYDIDARKIVMGQIAVPYFGIINVFSTHLSWWGHGFREQFEKLHRWAASKASPEVTATLLCGDFNNTPNSAGYALLSQDYEDQFARAQRRLRSDIPDERIDFILMNKAGALEVTRARRLFTPDDYGPVSDHPGFYAEFEPRRVSSGMPCCARSSRETG